MSRRLITGFSNPDRQVRCAACATRSTAGASGEFLAEGLRLLTDARAAGRLPEMLVMASGRDAHPLLDALEADVAAAGGEVIEMNEEILAKVTGKDNPQAVAGVFAEFDTSLDDSDRAAAPIWLVAQALRDPGNLGTMLRTGDAVGAGGLILIDDCADPFSVEAVRASMGAIFTQRVAQARWDEFLPWLRGGPGQLVAASLRDAQALSRRGLRGAVLPDGRQRIARAARKPTRTPATCASPCRCAAAPTASTRRSPAAVLAYEVLAALENPPLA